MLKGIDISHHQGSPDFKRIRAGGRWLPEVYNLRDFAGLPGKAITDVAARVTAGGGYWPWQLDSQKTNGQDGYAGSFGRTIDHLQICIE